MTQTTNIFHQLPTLDFKDAILEAVDTNQVVILTAETGGQEYAGATIFGGTRLRADYCDAAADFGSAKFDEARARGMGGASR